jgi:hypothetical protein
MESVFLAKIIEYKESLRIIGVFSTAEAAMYRLREHSAGSLYFREHTIRVSGRKFWVAELDEFEYQIDEMWVE